MNIYSSLCYLAESISILEYCSLDNTAREEFRERVKLAFTLLDERKVNFNLQNYAIALGGKLDIRAVGYDAIDLEIRDKLGLSSYECIAMQ